MELKFWGRFKIDAFGKNSKLFQRDAFGKDLRLAS